MFTAGQDPERLGEAQTYFTQGEGRPAPTFFESVSLWKSPEVAGARMSTFNSQTSECRSLRGQLPDGQSARFSLTARPAPWLGDQAVAVSVRVEPDGQAPAFIDLIAVRLDDAIVFTNGER